MSLNSQDQKTKSFWERPEGTTGMLTLGAAGVGLFFAAPAILAFVSTLTAIVGQTFMLAILGTGLFVFLNIVLNPKVQMLASFMFKRAMRWITQFWTEIDPIGIMRLYIKRLLDKRENMAISRDKLRGQLTVLKRQIDQNGTEYEKSMAMAARANSQQNSGVFSVQSRQAGRLEKLNKESLVPLHNQMELHLKALNKFYDVTGTVIEDLKNEVSAREIERKMILESHSAMKSAKAILNGDADAKELFDQAMEFVVEDFGMKMGEIDSFIENSRGFVEGLDMQNGVYEADALKKLQAWENKADSILLGHSKAQLLEMTNLNSPTSTMVGVPSPSSVDYKELLTKR